MSAGSCLLLADFNVGNLAAYMRNDREEPVVEIIEAPYDQVVPVLADPTHACWDGLVRYAVVWTRPESVSPTFADMLRGRSTDIGKLEAEVDSYAELLIAVGARLRLLCVPVWVADPHQRGLGMADMREGGIAYALLRMNARLLAMLGSDSKVYALDAQRWCALAGVRAFDPRLWYMGKIAFGNEVFKAAVPDLKAAFRGIEGRAKKMIVVDLDDTLWGGSVGEIGVEELALGGHDRAGEAFLDFQRALKALQCRGILLTIVSKNEEEVALAAVDSHPEMVLRSADFAGWRIDWGDKAAHIVSIATELNIGLQDVVFIDDNAAERARVREALPTVLVPDWPADPAHYTRALEQLRCFDAPIRTWEDAQRNRMYADEQARRQELVVVASLAEWLQTLELKVVLEQVKPTNLRRTVQLMNKTNQMNLSTRRLSEAELVEWTGQPEREAWVCSVEDRFGDSGLTGVLSLEQVSGGGRIVDFVLSCRVMGRGVEETLLHHAVARARAHGWRKLLAEYLPTQRNKPCFDLLTRVLMSSSDAVNCFHWDACYDFSLPTHIELA